MEQNIQFYKSKEYYKYEFQISAWYIQRTEVLQNTATSVNDFVKVIGYHLVYILACFLLAKKLFLGDF